MNVGVPANWGGRPVCSVHAKIWYLLYEDTREKTRKRENERQKSDKKIKAISTLLGVNGGEVRSMGGERRMI